MYKAMLLKHKYTFTLMTEFFIRDLICYQGKQDYDYI